jgi:hypothetical protein
VADISTTYLNNISHSLIARQNNRRHITVNIYLLELHFDHGSRYINVRGTDIVDALTTAQMIYPNMLVTIPTEWEEAI